MRLRGSSRVTMLDTDLSATGNADVGEEELMDVLEVQTDEISIQPERVTAGSDLLKVFPVRFRMRPSPIAVPRGEDRFRVDFAARGLALGAELLPFRHGYPFEVGLEDEKVPVMHLAEAVAEKIIAFGAFLTAKHYADLAYAVDPNGGDLTYDEDDLRDLTRKKLESWVERFPGLAERVGLSKDIASLEPRFTQDIYLRALKFQWLSEIRYVGDPAYHYSFNDAKALVEERLLPLLFPRG